MAHRGSGDHHPRWSLNVSCALVATNASPIISSFGVTPSSLRIVDNALLSVTTMDSTGVAVIEIRLDDTLVQTCRFAPVISPATCSYDAGQLSRGSYSATFTAYDADEATDVETFVFKAAAATIQNRVVLSTLAAGENAVLDLHFTLAGTDSGLLTLTLPGEFIIGSAADELQSSGCLEDLQYGDHTLTAVKNGCPAGEVFMKGAHVTNPSTPGNYILRWSNDLGHLSPATVSSSDASSVRHVCTRLSSNATSGVTVTVRSLNAGLRSQSVPDDFIPSTTASATPGISNYGICVGSEIGDTGSGSPQIPSAEAPVPTSPFNGACTVSGHAVGGVTADVQEIWSVAGPTFGAFAKVYMKAAVSTTQPAHNDYHDTLTFVATSTY